MAKKPDITAAGADLALAAGALVLGLTGAGALYAGAGLLFAVLVWLATRWPRLRQMAPMRRLSQSAVALGVLAVVLGITYWIGLLLGGHT